MEVRPIDAYTLNNELLSWYNDTEDETEKSILRCVMQMVVHAPTLTPPNEWVSRVRELEELYTKLHAVTGFTAEQLLEMFAAGYTLEKADYSKDFEEMAKLEEVTSPNEALTLEELREMDGEPVWVQTPGIPKYGCWVIVAGVDTEYGQRTLYCQGDYTCRNYGRDWIAYRRPPEGEADA